MRLIDADCLNFECQHYNKSQMKAILDFVDAQPTAYDLDNVVEQLKELHEGYECTDNEFQRGAKAGAHYILNRVIEIVKGGGVNE